MKTNKIELEKGYILEVVETIPNSEGKALEAYLYDGDMLIDELISNVRYSTVNDAISDYKLNILPKYKLRKNSGNLSELTKVKIQSIVTKYVMKRAIKYGAIIDAREVLTKAGYLEPDILDPNVSNPVIENYKRLLTITSLALVKELEHRNFYPDRNSCDRTYTYDDDKVKLEKCMNLVFTRYPWYKALKMYKLVNAFKRASSVDFVDHNKVADLKKHYIDVFTEIVNTNDALHELNQEFNKLADEVFQAPADKLADVIANNIDKMVKRYRKICPYK